LRQNAIFNQSTQIYRKKRKYKKGGKIKPMTIEDRREQLFDIFGNKTDNQIIEENPQFSELSKINNMTYADKKST
jgi:hypothetical protein